MRGRGCSGVKACKRKGSPLIFSYKLAQSVVHYLKQREVNAEKHSSLSDIANPAIKAASLAMLAKAGGII